MYTCACIYIYSYICVRCVYCTTLLRSVNMQLKGAILYVSNAGVCAYVRAYIYRHIYICICMHVCIYMCICISNVWQMYILYDSVAISEYATKRITNIDEKWVVINTSRKTGEGEKRQDFLDTDMASGYDAVGKGMSTDIYSKNAASDTCTKNRPLCHDQFLAGRHLAGRYCDGHLVQEINCRGLQICARQPHTSRWE